LNTYVLRSEDLIPIDSVLELTATGAKMKHEWLQGSRLIDYKRRDSWIHENPQLRASIADANELEVRELSDRQVDALMAFLGSLTDPSAEDRISLVPDTVPSGLSVED